MKYVQTLERANQENRTVREGMGIHYVCVCVSLKGYRVAYVVFEKEASMKAALKKTFLLPFALSDLREDTPFGLSSESMIQPRFFSLFPIFVY